MPGSLPSARECRSSSEENETRRLGVWETNSTWWTLEVFGRRRWIQFVIACMNENRATRPVPMARHKSVIVNSKNDVIFISCFVQAHLRHKSPAGVFRCLTIQSRLRDLRIFKIVKGFWIQSYFCIKCLIWLTNRLKDCSFGLGYRCENTWTAGWHSPSSVRFSVSAMKASIFSCSYHCLICLRWFMSPVCLCCWKWNLS